MKSFSKVFENKDIEDKIREIEKSINDLKDVECSIDSKISGKKVELIVKIKFEKGMKKLKTDALSKGILDKLPGYINTMEYSTKEDKMTIELSSFDHLL